MAQVRTQERGDVPQRAALRGDRQKLEAARLEFERRLGPLHVEMLEAPAAEATLAERAGEGALAGALRAELGHRREWRAHEIRDRNLQRARR